MQLRPSHAHRWIRCAAAPTFEGRVPEQPDNDAAREGTCAAWVADAVLKGDAFEAADMIGRTHPNGWFVTPDMAEHVQGYVDLIKSRGGVTTTEQFVRLTPNIGGTLDSSTSAVEDMLFVDDLKYGFRIVEVFENPQVLIYGGAELIRLNDPNIKRVQLGIYQPRAFHPDGIYRTVIMTVSELWTALEFIVARGNACLQPNPVATPGRQCVDCRALTSCYAAAATSYQTFTIIEDHRQRQMTAPEASREWLFLEEAERLIKARKSALDAEITERMRKEHFPGIGMKSRKGNRKFAVSPEVIRWLTGIDPFSKALVTPAELERQGAPVAVVSHLAITPDIGHKLERLQPNHIAKAFNNGTGSS